MQYWCEYFVYCLRNNINGREYIGCTMDFDKRYRSHLAALESGNHIVKELQHDWNLGHRLIASIIDTTDDYIQALKIEGEHITERSYNKMKNKFIEQEYCERNPKPFKPKYPIYKKHFTVRSAKEFLDNYFN